MSKSTALSLLSLINENVHYCKRPIIPGDVQTLMVKAGDDLVAALSDEPYAQERAKTLGVFLRSVFRPGAAVNERFCEEILIQTNALIAYLKGP
ncbi:hypothetical protein [Prosthecobacter sp.]|uniref:hypothetical protein n=1 Tax=Prosthecobacter sp. TaxID=1965333 RepID=UPI003783F9F4